MGKEKGLANNSKWLAGIVAISVVAILILVMLIYDVMNPITTKELSKSAALKLSKAVDEANGKKSKVTAKYIDIEGNELAPSEVLEGIVGEEYKFGDKKISGYKLIGDEPYAKSGNFQNRDMEVEFIYKESNENVDIAEGNDNDVIVRMKSQKLISEYNLKIITKDETGNLVKGVAYEVSKNGDEMRSGMVQGDTFVAGIITINKEGDDAISIAENPGDYFESLVNGDIEFTINKVWDTANGKYLVSVDYDKTLNGVDIKIEGTDILVTITNKAKIIIPEDGGDPEPNPEEPKPEKPQKVFDLEITKYISKIIVDNGKASKEVNRTIADKDNLVKIEIDAKEINNSTVTITYNLVIKNVGEIAGYATEITDYIPDNFELVDQEGWMKAAKVIITNNYSNKLLNPGDEIEVPITFEWKLDENHLGLRKNQAQITMYSNEENIKDITPDNIDDAQMIVTIKTGLGKTIGFGTLITLIIFALVIYKEKFNNE